MPGRPEADLFAGDELQASEKDRAENVMIVDLLRNDLSRRCRPGSVRVPSCAAWKRMNTCSTSSRSSEASLRDGLISLDLFAASFPGGSVTGAPKVRAMEIIAELEPTVRGPYCGSFGYVGCDGTMDTNILIRTITAARGWWQFQSAAASSPNLEPQSEYEETWHKAAGLLRAIAI